MDGGTDPPRNLRLERPADGSQSGSQRAQSLGHVRRRAACIVSDGPDIERHGATSSARMELIWEQEAAGSNPAIPTGHRYFSTVFAPLVVSLWQAAHGAQRRSAWLGGCARWLPRLCRHKAPPSCRTPVQIIAVAIKPQRRGECYASGVLLSTRCARRSHLAADRSGLDRPFRFHCHAE